MLKNILLTKCSRLQDMNESIHSFIIARILFRYLNAQVFHQIGHCLFCAPKLYSCCSNDFIRKRFFRTCNQDGLLFRQGQLLNTQCIIWHWKMNVAEHTIFC